MKNDKIAFHFLLKIASKIIMKIISGSLKSLLYHPKHYIAWETYDQFTNIRKIHCDLWVVNKYVQEKNTISGTPIITHIDMQDSYIQQ